MRACSKKLPFTALLQDLGLVCDVLHTLCKFSTNVQERNMELNKVYHNISSLEQIFEERQMIMGHYYKSAAKVAKSLCLLHFYFIKRQGKWSPKWSRHFYWRVKKSNKGSLTESEDDLQKHINIWWEDCYKPVNRLSTKERLTDSVSDWMFSEKLLHLKHTTSIIPTLWSEDEQPNSANKSVSRWKTPFQQYCSWNLFIVPSMLRCHKICHVTVTLQMMLRCRH